MLSLPECAVWTRPVPVMYPGYGVSSLIEPKMTSLCSVGFVYVTVMLVSTLLCGARTRRFGMVSGMSCTATHRLSRRRIIFCPLGVWSGFLSCRRRRGAGSKLSAAVGYDQSRLVPFLVPFVVGPPHIFGDGGEGLFCV